jgi:type III pantothenate kinase
MIVCLDCGNSRLKWGVCADADWLEQGACAHDEIAQIAELPRRWPQVERIVMAHVAGAELYVRIGAQLAAWGLPIEPVRAQAAVLGVRNGYRDPAALGVDRWCALIGAHALFPGRDCLVVCAGTATTVDALHGDGRFAGGLILPGLSLMLASLVSNTAQLPLAAGELRAWPQTTDDAIVSGCVEAQVGAIERARARLPDGALCVLAGGGAARLLPLLGGECVGVEYLTLEGVRHLARVTRVGGTGECPEGKTGL